MRYLLGFCEVNFHNFTSIEALVTLEDRYNLASDSTYKSWKVVDSRFLPET